MTQCNSDATILLCAVIFNYMKMITVIQLTLLFNFYIILIVIVQFYLLFRGFEKLGHINLINYTSWVAVLTSTHRHKSVRNHCVIERFDGVFVLVFFLWIYIGIRVFVMNLSIPSLFSIS